MNNLNFLAQIRTPGQQIPKISETAGGAFSDSIGWILNAMPLAIGAIIVVFFSFVLAKIVKVTVIKSLSTHNADDQVVLLVGKVSHVGVLIIGFTIALEILGVDISPVVGLVGLGFGFAMQDIIKNFVCGALILVQEPFKIGDIVKVGEFIGRVEAIESRSTNIKTFDGQRVIVPNADMFSSSVINFSSHPERRLEIVVGVHYATDLGMASRIILSEIESHEEILKNPVPKTILSEFGDSSITISVKFWVDKDSSIFEIRSEILSAIKIAFEREGINIPYPIRTLDMTTPVGVQDVLSKVSEKNTDMKSKIENIPTENSRVTNAALRNKQNFTSEEVVPQNVDIAIGADNSVETSYFNHAEE